jgi:hypothetical protein
MPSIFKIHGRPVPTAARGGKVAFQAADRVSPLPVSVEYDPSLGDAGLQVGQRVLDRAPGDFARVQQIFRGAVPSDSNFVIRIVTADEQGQPFAGAFHVNCANATLFCNPINPETQSLDADWTNFLAVAEAVEVFEDRVGDWVCNQTNGEGLSRTLAAFLYPNVIPSSRGLLVSTWLNGGRPDFVSTNDADDQNDMSNGCAVLFLNWLHSQFGYAWDQVAIDGAAPSLAETFVKLQGLSADVPNPSAVFPKFLGFLEQFFPSGTLVSLDTDNPFPLGIA